MATSEINQVLAALIDSVRGQPLTSPTPGTSDIAQQILKNSRVNWQPRQQELGGGKPSVISRVFDVLSRPNYAMAEAFKRAADPEKENILKGWSDFVSGLGAGLRGDVDPNMPGAQKTTFSDVLEQAGVKNKVAKGVGGFAMDVLLDPTTYIGVGALKSAGKTALKAAGVETAEKALPKAAPTLSLAEAVRPKAHTEIVADVEPAESLLDQLVSGAVPVHAVSPKPKLDVSDPLSASIAQKTAREYLRKLKIPADKSFSPRQQTLLYTNLLRKTGNDPVKATAMLTEAERWLGTQGVSFKLWDGSRGSLSDVIAEVGPKKLTPDLLRQYSRGKVTDSKLMQAAEIQRARSTMADAPKIQGLLQDISKAMSTADASMSPAAAKNVKKNIKLHQPELALSPVGFETVNKFIKELGEQSEGYVQVALDRKVRTLHAVVSGDTRKISDVTSAMNRAKEEAMGIHYKDLGGQRALDTLAMTFSTWYKNPQLRALGHTSSLVSRSSAAARVHDLNAHLTGRTQAQINNAWRAAQGYTPTDDPLAKYFRDNLERLFSSSGIKDEADSVALRSALIMKDINTELQRLSAPHKYPVLKNIRFTQKHVTDPVTGGIRNYSGVNWLKSWETWKTDKPQEVLYGLQTAVETVMKDYALKDDIAARFGAKIPHGDFTHKIDGIRRLDGYYFPKEIAEQIPVLFKNLRDMYQSKSEIVRLFDKALSSWKRGVTIYVPSHHVRNLQGDVFFSWMAGVNDPRVYIKSAQILRALKDRYKGAHIDELVGRGAAERAVGGKVILRKHGKDITDEMFYVNAHQNGLLLTAKDIEDVFGDGLSSFKPFGGKLNQVASKTAELREHYAILAHYIDAVRRSKKTNMKEVFADAAAEVRKWHPNGTDLTATERSVFRRMIPFYSWTRKAIPLVIESIMFNPGRVAVLPKMLQAGQTSLGIDVPGRQDPFPVDQAFPGWLREQGIGPMGKTGMGGLAGFLGSLGRQEQQDVTGENLDAYTVFGTHMNPVTDIFAQFEPNPLKGIMESTNPAIQSLFELGRGQTLSGREIGQDPLRYTAESVPIVDPIYRILNRPGSQRGKDEGRPINIEALLNTLFGLGIVGTGPYIPQRRQ